MPFNSRFDNVLAVLKRRRLDQQLPGKAYSSRSRSPSPSASSTCSSTFSSSRTLVSSCSSRSDDVPQLLITPPEEEEDGCASPKDGSSIHVSRPLARLPPQVHYATASGGRVQRTHAAHETLTLAALHLADPERWPAAAVTAATVDAPTWEIFRGLAWNDDPSCTLFDDDDDDEEEASLSPATPAGRTTSYGGVFGADFQRARAEADVAGIMEWPLTGLRGGSLAGRAWFYDLQFLHAMAAEPGELAAETKAKMMLWAQVMYRLAAGGDDGIDPETRIDDVDVEVDGVRLGQLFDDGTAVRGSETLGRLLLANGARYRGADARLRALGSLLHVVQDSYAEGHAVRAGGGRGGIVQFGCCLGHRWQGHTHFTNAGLSDVSPDDVDNFAHVPGARMAIRVCSEVVRLWRSGAPWEGEVEHLLASTLSHTHGATR